MTISYNWLKDFIKTDLSPEEISELLTSCGLEVESLEKYETIKGGLKGVVVGEVLTCEKHPDADRLRITTVNVGKEQPLNIVCGAPNVAAGQKVLVATVGTTLFMNNGEKLDIKKSKIRGAVSEGMICAEDELGIGHSHDGILVLSDDKSVGTPAVTLFDNYEDWIFEIGLTPNRADAASHLGVARDLAALIRTRKNLNTEIVIPSVGAVKEEGSCAIEIEVVNKEKCIRYAGLVMEGIEVKESPAWLRNRLEAIGLRAINNIVDVTNYVLHELGQPLHAFDFDAIEGKKVIVQTLSDATVFTTLDGVERKLSSEDLMICNAKEPMCIAGVFGGLKSGVTEKTRAIFLESACFHPVAVRKTSKQHGLKTDSSFRFERGVDPNITVYALQRAAQLIMEVSGGAIKGGITDIYPEEVKNFEVNISYEYIGKIIGKIVPKEKIKEILHSLSISISFENETGLTLSVPPFKVDVTRPIDVVEEILRIYGYNNVEFPEKLNSSVVISGKPDRFAIQNTISDLLVSNGYSEIMCNSLSSSSFNSNNKAVRILNPLSSELDVMRDSLIYGGLQALTYNINRKQSDLKLFEFGKTYLKAEKGYQEQSYLSLWVSGYGNSENWNSKQQKVSFYDLKTAVETVLKRCSGDFGRLKTAPLENEKYDYAMSYSFGNKTIVTVAKIKKTILKKFDCDQEVYYAEFDWDALINLCAFNKVQFSELPKYPEVRRDLSLLIDKQVSFGQLEEEALKTEKRLVKNVNLFDVYEGDKLPQGKKSYAISFILQDDQSTLTDQQIDGIMNKIIKTYESKFSAVLRG